MINLNQNIMIHAVCHYCENTDKQPFEVSIKKALPTLENKQDEASWHLRLYNNIDYSLYFDIDEGNLTAEQIKNHFNEVPQFKNKKICISQNENSIKKSFHIVFPEFKGTLQDQKQIITGWNNDYPDFKADTSVYNDNRLFRLPNQLKPNSDPKNRQGLIKNTRHNIIAGEMYDFLLIPYENAEQIPKATTIAPEKKDFVASPVSQQVPTTEIDKLIDCLSSKRATDFETWIQVGMCLRNIETENGANLNAWKKFSLKSPKADSLDKLTETYFKFNPKTKEEKGFKIGSLKMWSKQDNPDLFKQYFPTKCLFENYENEFSKWEKRHCKILNPPTYIEHLIYDEHESFIIRNTAQLQQAYNHLSILVPKLDSHDKPALDENGNQILKKELFIQKWTVANDNIRKYQNIGIYPAPLICPAETLNCWTSFRSELLPKPTKDYSDELNTFKFLLSVLTGHEKIATDYFEKWIAQAIQFPAIKTSVPTIITKEGAGKGTLLKLLTAMLGEKKVLSTTEKEVVFGRFNNQMLDAYIVNLDEFEPKDVKDVEGKIKALITEPKISIDIKGVSSFSIRSFHRFINTTNNEFGVFKTHAHDRRNFICRGSDELIGNAEFFRNFNETIIEKKEVVRFIYEYLKSIPNLEKFHEPGNIPKTSYGEELKQCNRNDYDLWLEDFTMRNSEKGVNEFRTKELFNDFCVWTKKDNFCIKSFGIRIINIVPKAICAGKKTRDGQIKIFDWKLLKEHYKTECLIKDDDDDDECNDDQLSQATTSSDVYIDGVLQAD